MIVLVIILFLLSLGFSLSKTFNFKLENSIALGFMGISLLLFVFGMINLLYFGFFFVVFLCFLSTLFLIYNLVKKQVHIKEFLKPSILIWVVGLIILFLIVKRATFIAFDEYFFWGTNIKAMFYKNILWNSKSWIGFHTSYPPLMGIVSYFVLKLNGGYSEGMAMFSYAAFILTLILPLLSNIKKENKNSIIIGIILFFLPGMFYFSYKTICADLVLGIAFFLALYFMLEKNSIENRVLYIFSLLTLIFIKTSGIVLLGVVLLIDLIRALYDHKFNKKFIKKYVLILGVIIVFYSLFTGYNKLNNAVLDIKHDNNYPIKIGNVSEFFNVLSGNSTNNNYIETIKTFTDKIVNGEVISKTIPINKTLGVLLLINIGLYIILKKEKNLFKSISLGLNIGFIVYILFLLFTFLFVFIPEEGVLNASFERYMDSFFIAFTLLFLMYVIKNNNKQMLLFTLVIVLLGITNVKYYYEPYGEIDAFDQSTLNASKIIINRVKSDEKVFIIYQNGINFDFYKLKYLISPINTNLIGEWSTRGENNEILKNSNELLKHLDKEKYDYLFIKNIDGYFFEYFGDFLEEYFNKDETYSDFKDKLFKIKKKNNIIKLELIK